ncbi:pimeloyl-ACP methyl ester esterase BioH [Ferrimonas pelagia]|uniref:Pimeloyl-[acyl-carrier protein] methyl ester esterase n=1 Tax=Ferrimonas pelagia TaxID=1177826 RepID=A0ABP9F7D8_9GAMM
MSIVTSLETARPGLQIDWYGAGPSLLILHGWGMNGAVWQGLAPRLAQLGFRVGCVDLPGFGHSASLRDAGSLSQWAEAVWQAVDGETKCHLMGWSLGGSIAMQMALSAPQRTASLVSIASSPCFQAEPGWPGIKPAVLAQFSEQLAQDLDKTLAGFFALQAMGSASARDDVRQLKRAVLSKPAARPDALAAGLRLLAQADLRGQIDQINAPWLRLYGRLDGLVPARGIEPASDLAPHSEVAILPQASHAPFVSHPEQTFEILEKFYLSV